MKQILRSALLAASLPDFDVLVSAHALEMRTWRAHMARVAADETANPPVPDAQRHVAHPPPATHPLVAAAIDDEGHPDFEIIEDGPTPEQVLAAKKADLLSRVTASEYAAKAAVARPGKRRLFAMREDAIRAADAKLARGIAEKHRAAVEAAQAAHAVLMDDYHEAIRRAQEAHVQRVEQHRERIARCALEHSQETAQEARRYAAAYGQAEVDHSRQVEQRARERADEHRQAELEHKQEVERLAREHAEEVNRLAREHADLVAEHRAEHPEPGLVARAAIAAGLKSAPPPGPAQLPPPPPFLPPTFVPPPPFIPPPFIPPAPFLPSPPPLPEPPPALEALPPAPKPPDLPPAPDIAEMVRAARADNDTRHLEEQQARRERIAAIERAAAQAHHDIEDLTADTVDGWQVPDFN